MSRRDFEQAVADAIDRNREATRDTRRRRVIGRNTDGTEIVMKLDAVCIERSGIDGNQIGSIVEGPATPPFSNRGVASIPLPLSVPSLLFHVERQDPEELPRGETTTVAIYGRGLFDGLSFEYLLADGETPHPGIAVDSAIFVSDTEYELEVSVDADAEAGGPWPIAYG